MNRILFIVVTDKCSKCPYLKWEVNESCSNSAGNSNCINPRMLRPRLIENNNKHPEIPDWCLLEKEKE